MDKRKAIIIVAIVVVAVIVLSFIVEAIYVSILNAQALSQIYTMQTQYILRKH